MADRGGNGGNTSFATIGQMMGKAVVAGLSVAAWPARFLPAGMRAAVARPPRKVLRASTVLSRAILDAVDQFAAPSAEVAEAEELKKPGVHVKRNDKQDSAIVFVHGFGMNSGNTWGAFPDFLTQTPALAPWDIFTVGYESNLRMDLVGLWAAAPPIAKLGQFLQTAASIPPLDRYESLAFIAHSMGGLVVQRALVAGDELRNRTSHFVCYGTPSDGLKKANLLRSLKTQARDMAAGSEFVTTLRQDWSERIGDRPPFEFMAVAGDVDEFVPAWSSLGPFPEHQVGVIPGNHLEVVSAQTAEDAEVRLAVKFIVGDAAPAGPWNSARVAIEGRDFHRAIDQLYPHSEDLDERNLIFLALALESVSRQKDAIQLLEQAPHATTDLLGTLAGRLKRRWLEDGRAGDGARAEELYAQALVAAEADGNSEQIYYLAINVAFMRFAHGGDRTGARELAEKALVACAAVPEDYWRLATEAEAHLYKGEHDRAVELYRRALAREPKPWQVSSTYHQATTLAERLDAHDAVEQLRVLFREQCRAG